MLLRFATVLLLLSLPMASAQTYTLWQTGMQAHCNERTMKMPVNLEQCQSAAKALWSLKLWRTARLSQFVPSTRAKAKSTLSTMQEVELTRNGVAHQKAGWLSVSTLSWGLANSCRLPLLLRLRQTQKGGEEGQDCSPGCSFHWRYSAVCRWPAGCRGRRCRRAQHDGRAKWMINRWPQGRQRRCPAAACRWLKLNRSVAACRWRWLSQSAAACRWPWLSQLRLNRRCR